MKTKIRHINRISNPYGGILFCMEELQRKGIPRLIDNFLGKRVKQAKYSYSDILLSWVYSVLCGSERLEDVKQLKHYFSEIPDNRHPSPDRIADIFKSFATPITKHYKEKIDHELNLNIPLNELLLHTAFKLGQLNKNSNATLDYDNVITPCEKYDSRKTYKEVVGYFPSVAFIGKTPVYIENRNGNSVANYQLLETLERSINIVEKRGIKIKRFRSDSAAYSKNVLIYLNQKGIEFFIRAQNSNAIFRKALESEDGWENVIIGDMPSQAYSFEYDLYDNTYRVVVSKLRDSRQTKVNKYSNDLYTYRAIITNNRKMSSQEVISFYNQRGAIELNFTTLLNDWNWKRLPFSFLNQNTVFMIMGAIGNIIYNYLLSHFSKKLHFVKSNYKLKNFIFNFITISLEWTFENNEKIAYINSDRDYSPLYARPPSIK